VLRVLLGFDGGWPPSNRTDGVLSIGQAWAGSWWIACFGAGGLAMVMAAAPALTIWSLPVALPMIFAPLVIAASSRPVAALRGLWRVPSEAAPSPVLQEWRAIHDGWTGPAHQLEQDFAGGTADVLG